MTFPVILSTGSHPFPSRTRKLSLLEPMVLRGKLCGRVGSRRDYFKARSLIRAGFSIGFRLGRAPSPGLSPTNPHWRIVFVTANPVHNVLGLQSFVVGPSHFAVTHIKQ